MYIGTWPAIKAPSWISFGLRSNVVLNPSPLSDDITRTYLDGAKWVMDWQYDILRDADASQVAALLAKLRGSLNTFSLPIWGYAQRGTYSTSSATYAATYAKGVTTIAIVDATQAGKTLMPGDMFNDGPGDLYMVVEPATANGAGQITLVIEPPLRIQKTTSIGVWTGQNNVTAVAMMTSSEFRMEATGDKFAAKSSRFQAVYTIIQ